MNRGLRICLALFLFASVLSCASKQQRATDHWLELEKEAIRRQHEAMLKYKTGDYQTAKSALVDLLQFLDKAGYPPNAPNEFRQDAMMTCARLAKLEEKNHGSEQAAYMNQAITRCQSFPLHGKCDEDWFRKEVDRLDALTK